MIEAVEGLRFLEATLRASTAFMNGIPGGLYRGYNTKLPQGVFPDQIFCVFSYAAGGDIAGGGGVRIAVNGVFVAQCIGPGSDLDTLSTVAGLMDDLIQGAKGTTSTGTIYYLLRERDLVLDENINNRLVSHLGGYYRSLLQKSGS